MFFPFSNFDLGQRDNNLNSVNDNSYNPQTNYHQDLYSLFLRFQHQIINGDPAEVEGLPWYSDLLCLATLYDPIDPFAGMFMDEDNLIKTSLDLPLDHNNNLMDKSFEMIISSNIDASHETKKNARKRKRIVDIKSDVIKGQWTPEEDRLLIELVEKYGVGKWSSIAQMLTGRIERECRDRWHNHLHVKIKRERWSEKEDQILIETHMQLGNKWSEILQFLPGRSVKAIMSHWCVAKRNSRNSNSNDAPLQNYIRSLNKTGEEDGVEREPNKRRGRGELEDVC